MARSRNITTSFGPKRHALFFFLIYIVGALLLTFEKTVVYSLFAQGSALPKTIVITTAMVLMGIYVFFVTLVPATKLRTDVAADNVYYLGFLFTLTSLAIALSIDNADAILANFGVAIISTLIGIAARVGLNQLRVDPSDIEEASRLELSEATGRVKAELNETVRQLTDFREISLQVLAEGYAEVQKNVETISTQVLKSVEDLVEQSSKPLIELAEKAKAANTEAVNSFADVTKSNQALTKSHRAMSTQIEQVNSALTTLSKHYSDTGIIDDKVIGAVQAQLLNVQNQLTKKAQEELDALKSSVSEAKRDSAELRTELSRISPKVVNENKLLNSPTIEDTATTAPPKKQTARPTLRADKRGQFSEEAEWEEHLGASIRYRANRTGFWVDDQPYPTLFEARKAIESKQNSTKPKS